MMEELDVEVLKSIDRVLIDSGRIHARISELGKIIDEECKPPSDSDHSMLLVLGVLTGSFIFVADLSRAITIPHEVQFMRASSYQGTESTGSVTITGLEVS